jgi:hypothetical protein
MRIKKCLEKTASQIDAAKTWGAGGAVNAPGVEDSQKMFFQL